MDLSSEWWNLAARIPPPYVVATRLARIAHRTRPVRCVLAISPTLHGTSFSQLFGWIRHECHHPRHRQLHHRVFQRSRIRVRCSNGTLPPCFQSDGAFLRTSMDRQCRIRLVPRHGCIFLNICIWRHHTVAMERKRAAGVVFSQRIV